jgi:fatty acid desaturase
MHPNVAWYDLPALYATNRAHYLRRNDGYVFTSYGDVFRRYFWHAKDPVPHPLWRKDD